ncbi:MAG: riboflavin synthase [Gemmataceae bacterium]|nr:riboflavin synthase [Gemmataceae bacterium]
MFTGLVETMGNVVAATNEGEGRRLTIDSSLIADGLPIGASVAVNGVCLTAVAIRNSQFDFEAGPETLKRTNLGEVRPGDRVNLERALKVGDRLGGHIVQGHVDAVGEISKREREGEWEVVRFACPADLTSCMVPKGSITVDGVSLTLVDVNPGEFSVALIPHTMDATTLGFKPVGATVNLEVDIFAKYIQKQWQSAAAEWMVKFQAHAQGRP